jgi:tRNA G37 N-methylase TrmD
MDGEIKMNVRPRLSFIARDDGGWFLKIEPSPLFDAPVQSIVINDDERKSILMWQQGRVLIQEALRHWSDEKRELLLTGMDNSQLHKYLGAG